MPSADQYQTLRGAAAIVDRSSRGRLMLSGEDRLSYLQGLLTNDVAALAPGTGCYAAYLTPQGRMIADMRLFELGGTLLVDLDASRAAAVAERWDMFVITEDVRIANVSDTLAQVGLYGPASARVLSRALGSGDEAAGKGAGEDALQSMPMFGSARRELGGRPVYVLRSDDVGVGGFDVVFPAEMKAELEALLLAHGAQRVDAETVEATRIEGGRPQFGVDMTEDTIPLEAGITDRAISLTKGCYVGQEVIIRVLHRGHGRVAKRLVGVALDASSNVPPPGTKLMSGDREVGWITSSVLSPGLGHPIALAYLHRDFTEPGTVVSVADGGATAATVRSLPFVAAS